MDVMNMYSRIHQFEIRQTNSICQFHCNNYVIVEPNNNK